MVGLGMQDDVPPDAIQPVLVDGIHLRWAFRRELGFPWYGFYLFRRPHHSGERACVSGSMIGEEPRELPSLSFSTREGVFTSDRNLVLTDDFDPHPTVEFDLRGRSFLRFTIAPASIARSVELTIGFRAPEVNGSDQVRVRVLFDGVLLEERMASASDHRVVFTADAISVIELSGGNAAVIDLCLTPLGQGATNGWEPLQSFSYPLALPVRDPTYPADPNQTDVGFSRTTALHRVSYGLPLSWAQGFPDLHALLLELVTGGPGSTPMSERVSANLGGTPVAPIPGVASPNLVDRRPLDMILLGSLNPAVAQMVGLYFVDKTAQPGSAYDYLIVASYLGPGATTAASMLAEINANGFGNVEAWIVFNKRVEHPSPLPPPAEVKAYALPGSPMAMQGGGGLSNTAGLSWSLGRSGPRTLESGSAVMYRLWRAALGNEDAPGTNGQYVQFTSAPVLVAEPKVLPSKPPERSPDWPPFRMYFIDIGLADGWYAYKATGIDIFGRHSAQSMEAQWWEWAPKPDPKPWYYIEPPGDQVVHPSAIRLLDKLPPPPPTDIEAYALDPSDPTFLRDNGYHTWFNNLSPTEKEKLVGLRVRWRWTENQMRQAPDAKEFRIYYQPGRVNVKIGHITSILTTSPAETLVNTDIDLVVPAGAFVGGYVLADSISFPIIGNDAGSPLRFRVRNRGLTDGTGTVSVARGSSLVAGVGTAWHAGMNGLRFQVDGSAAIYTILNVETPNQLTLTSLFGQETVTTQPYAVWDRRPPATGPISIAIPEYYSKGTVVAANGSATIVGKNTDWNTNFVGRLMTVEGSSLRYRVLSANSGEQLVVDPNYSGDSGDRKAYAIEFPGYIDYRLGSNWQERYYVVNYNDSVEVTVDDKGLPLRKYDILLPARTDTFRDGLDLLPTLEEPVIYAQVSVSTADDKTHTNDDPKWTGSRFGNRKGNEGDVGAMATIFCVRRTPPPPPAAPPDSERVFASSADYFGRSYYTFRWIPQKYLRTHIFRALDDALFATDWTNRPRKPLTADETTFFPLEKVDQRWNMAKRAQVASELNQLNTFPKTTPGSEQALIYYRSLSNDGLRILASLPGNEVAFTQLTAEGLDPDDPANFDRRGPDSDPAYIPQETLRAYIDRLDGRSSSRYFYRAAYVDRASNRSTLGLSTPPVWFPKVVGPRPPVLTRVLGGDRSITLYWASNREADLSTYEVYRAENENDARDLARMTRVKALAIGAPSTRPAEEHYTDETVEGLRTYTYRLVAMDSSGNRSQGSRGVSGRAYDEALPKVPVPEVAWVVTTAGKRAEVKWTSSDESMLQRREPGDTWLELASWMSPGSQVIRDPFSDPTHTYEYRLWARKRTGAVAKGIAVVLKP